MASIIRNTSILLVVVLLNMASVFGQEVSGTVRTIDNEPLPFVNVFLKGTQTGILTDNDGKYNFNLGDGFYELVFSAIGYESQEVPIVIRKNVNTHQDVFLKEQVTKLDAVVISGNGKDPAYAIIKEAVAAKKQWMRSIPAYTVNTYIRASERTEIEPSKRTLRTQESDTLNKKKQEAPKMNMVEASSVFHYQYPDQIKEIREGYEVRGDITGLYFTSFTDANFNFYSNLLAVDGLTATPLFSPLATSGVMAYKFKLLNSYQAEGNLIHRIKVTPRKLGNALFEGFIEIVDEKWCLHSVELTLDKSAVIAYDNFKIEQGFNLINDTTSLLSSQSFTYDTKAGKRKFKGFTTVHFKDYDLQPSFPKKFFSNELSITTKEAMERDSSFWEALRPAPLQPDEIAFIAYTDSVRAVKESQWYKDSIDSVYNKVTLFKVTLGGVSKYNRAKELRLELPPVISLVQPFMPGGTRIQLFTSVFKETTDKKRYRASVFGHYGLRNDDLKGEVDLGHLYDPFHHGLIGTRFGRRFEFIFVGDAIGNIFRRDNFYQKDHASLWFDRELINGLNLRTKFEFAKRSDLTGYEFGSVSEEVFNSEGVTTFEANNSFYTDVRLRYTPFQKYMREPYRKVILGSDYPTFGLRYKRGWNNVLGSQTKFDYLDFTIRQQFNIHRFGTSKYKLKSGVFLDTTALNIVDYAWQSKSQEWLFTDPLNSWQLMEETFPVFDLYGEVHYMHDFNGFWINKIPLLNKTRISTSAGVSALLVPEQNYQHVEAYFGLSRILRISTARIKVGGYYAIGKSNQTDQLLSGFKFFVDVFNRRTQKWQFDEPN